MNEPGAHARGFQLRTRSGVFPKQISAHHDDTEQAIIRKAQLGLASIQVRSVRKLRAIRAFSRANVKVGSQPRDAEPTAVAPHTHDRVAWFKRPHGLFASVLGSTPLKVAHRAWKLASFIDSLYVLLIVPFRVGFLFDPWSREREWTMPLLVLTALDLAGSLLRSWRYRQQLSDALQRVVLLLLGLISCGIGSKWGIAVQKHAFVKSESILHQRSSFAFSSSRLQSSRPEAVNLLQRDHSRRRISRGRNVPVNHRPQLSWFVVVGLAANCIPWELCVALLGINLAGLHVVGLLRFWQAKINIMTQFSAVVMPMFATWRPIQVLSFTTVAITGYLFVMGIYLCHFAASGYMLMAHIECGLSFEHCSKWPIPESWVLRDNLEMASPLRQYVRTLYWGCKTVVTLGQGDMIPATNLETAYRVCIQFLSGLWATAIVTAYTFYFTNKDANMSTNISTQLTQAKQVWRSIVSPMIVRI